MIAAALILAGCSSTPPEVVAMKHLQKQEAANKKQAKRQLDAMPEWLLEPPQSQEPGFYVAASAQAASLQTALDKAQLLAEYQMAKRLRQQLSGEERYFRQGEFELPVERNELVIKSIIDRQRVAGTTISQREVHPSEAGFTAYVLLHFSEAMAQRQKALWQQEATVSSLNRQADQAFERLEGEL